MSIYEELNEKKFIRLYSKIEPISVINEPFRFQYLNNKTNIVISCHLMYEQKQSQKNLIKTNLRKPAQILIKPNPEKNLSK